MRSIVSSRLEKGRVLTGALRSTALDGLTGAFQLTVAGKRCAVISTGPLGTDPAMEGWEHVSISLPSGDPPGWKVMNTVKDLFWLDEECVIQFHPPKSVYVNHHPGVLHLWKPPYETPTPPVSFIGPKA